MDTTDQHLADPELLEQAKRLGQHKTAQETINQALKEYIRWRKRIGEIQNFGTVDFDPEFLATRDQKAQLK